RDPRQPRARHDAADRRGRAGVRRQARHAAPAVRGSLGAMLDDATIVALAAELHDAQTRRVQLRHFSRRHPGMTIDDGYAIQRAWLKLRLAEGRVVRGRKIGLTSRAMQQSSQIDEPDFAP